MDYEVVIGLKSGVVLHSRPETTTNVEVMLY